MGRFCIPGRFGELGLNGGIAGTDRPTVDEDVTMGREIVWLWKQQNEMEELCEETYPVSVIEEVEGEEVELKNFLSATIVEEVTIVRGRQVPLVVDHRHVEVASFYVVSTKMGDCFDVDSVEGRLTNSPFGHDEDGIYSDERKSNLE